MVSLFVYGKDSRLGKSVLPLLEKEGFELYFDLKKEVIPSLDMVLYLLPSSLEEDYPYREIHREALEDILSAIDDSGRKIPLYFLYYGEKRYEPIERMALAHRPVYTYRLGNAISTSSLLYTFPEIERLLEGKGKEGEENKVHTYEFLDEVAGKLRKEIVSYFEYPRKEEFLELDFACKYSIDEKSLLSLFASFEKTLTEPRKIPLLSNDLERVLFLSYLTHLQFKELDPVYTYSYPPFKLEEIYKKEGVGSFLLLYGDKFESFGRAGSKDMTATYLVLAGNVSFAIRKEKEKKLSIEVLGAQNPQFFVVPPGNALSITPMQEHSLVLCHFDKVLDASSDDFISAGKEEDRANLGFVLAEIEKENPYEEIEKVKGRNRR